MNPSREKAREGRALRVPDFESLISTCLLSALALANPMSMNRPDPGRRHLPHLAPLEFANQAEDGKATRPEDWPHQGEMNVLSWHEAD